MTVMLKFDEGIMCVGASVSNHFGWLDLTQMVPTFHPPNMDEFNDPCFWTNEISSWYLKNEVLFPN
jgi:hypothetical protein